MADNLVSLYWDKDRRAYVVRLGVKPEVHAGRYKYFKYKGFVVARRFENIGLEPGDFERTWYGIRFKETAEVWQYPYDAFAVKPPFIVRIILTEAINVTPCFDVMVEDRIVRTDVKAHTFVRLSRAGGVLGALIKPRATTKALAIQY